MVLTPVVDSHVHSTCSPDSKIIAYEGIFSGIDKGLAGIVFTDHFDLEHPSTTHTFSFDFEARARDLQLLRNEYRERFKILDGIELGFQPHLVPDLVKTIQSHPFDFVICSTHIVDGFELSDKNFYAGKTKYQAYERYLETICQSVTLFGDFDVVGHIGYICRYAPFKDVSLKYSEYSDLLDEILIKVIARNKGIEINTSGLLYNLGFTHPDFDTIKRYKELGGEIITIGSDSHQNTALGRKFPEILSVLSSLGFRYVTHFERRRPVFTKI